MPKNAQTTAQLHSSHTLANNAQNSPSQASTVHELWTSRYTAGLRKAEGQRSSCQHPLVHQKSKRVPEKKIHFCFIDYAKVFDCVDYNKLQKILKEMGIPDHLTCLLRNLYAGQEVTVRTEHATTDHSKLGKEYIKAVYCHPAYLTFMQSTSCKMPGWMKHKLESRLLGEISITSDDITLMAESKDLQSLLMKVREWKSWLKIQHSEN